MLSQRMKDFIEDFKYDLKDFLYNETLNYDDDIRDFRIKELAQDLEFYMSEEGVIDKAVEEIIKEIYEDK